MASKPNGVEGKLGLGLAGDSRWVGRCGCGRVCPGYDSPGGNKDGFGKGELVIAGISPVSIACL